MATVLTTVYDVGDQLYLGNHSSAGVAAFTTLAGAAADPTAVTLTVRRPDGTLEVYGYPTAGANGLLTKETTGRFYRARTLDQSGWWRLRLEGTGTVEAAEEVAFLVRARKAG